MSEKVDNFCNDLRDHLNAVEERLDHAKANVQSAADEGREAVEAKKKKIEADFATKKDKVEDAKAKAKDWVDRKKAELEMDLDEWIAKREIRKLEKRAEHAEDYAVAAVNVAAAAVEEADYAILDAIASRMIADEAAG